jgi:hypothetical protein
MVCHGFTFEQTWPFWLQKRKHNPLCDADEEPISDMLNEELDIDSDDEMNMEIEGETASEDLSNKCQGVSVKHVLCMLMAGKT